MWENFLRKFFHILRGGNNLIHLHNYEFLEHTADLKIRVTSSGLKELFIDSAAAIFDIIAERKGTEPAQKIKVPIQVPLIEGADRLEDLFIDWLNEVISLSAAKEMVLSDFKIIKLDESGLQAEAMSESMNNYAIKTEIKAATRHELKLTKTETGWQAEVIFDV